MGLMLVRATLVAFSTCGLLTAGAASQSASPETKTAKRLPPAVQLKNVEPVYPRGAKEAGVQGKVVLDATIALDGTVVGVKVRQSIPALDAAAMAAVRQWRYAPYVVDGKPRSIILTVTVSFNLTQTGRGPDKNKRASRPDLLKLARTTWLCTTSAKPDDPPRRGYMYFHPNGDVKMAQVMPASNRGRRNDVSWWRTRQQYNAEDPSGRKWIDVEWVDDGNIWASREDQGRIIYGSGRPGLMVLSIPKDGTIYVALVELDDRSVKLVEAGSNDPFELTEHTSGSRSTMNCELRPGWLK